MMSIFFLLKEEMEEGRTETGSVDHRPLLAALSSSAFDHVRDAFPSRLSRDRN